MSENTVWVIPPIVAKRVCGTGRSLTDHDYALLKPILQAIRNSEVILCGNGIK